MVKRLIVGALFVGVGALVVQSIPDIRRYLRIRKM
ncbi:hypothetical protein FHR32_008759 [Streptosporangium album]|uniref:Uncharacterized protein n=1 Tax=Streptosporangium album TaxID=47479 RepID=A0A7W7WEY4_9ACTN|nr:hypothetical protein [Streptosporangium album]